MASPCLCKPPTASEPASRVKPVLKQTFGRASREAAREALPRAVPNGALASHWAVREHVQELKGERGIRKEGR